MIREDPERVLQIKKKRLTGIVYPKRFVLPKVFISFVKLAKSGGDVKAFDDALTEVEYDRLSIWVMSWFYTDYRANLDKYWRTLTTGAPVHWSLLDEGVAVHKASQLIVADREAYRRTLRMKEKVANGDSR